MQICVNLIIGESFNFHYLILKTYPCGHPSSGSIPLQKQSFLSAPLLQPLKLLKPFQII
ncbi:hypothetical protein JCM15548_12121 [Geofilum rubicundum JCM 15548]|uniref:Uncharacterized protein n=1 Tax=Geofilum rubicundum JCM 15548 TaxID=1236989 RepID=A0A0E9LWE8_9BACT|nr:hypothetical protein JCM15548_12121 [Geofilum rubicundum JCM 15548]